MRWREILLGAFILLTFRGPCFSQERQGARPPAQRPRPAPARAPYLLQVKSFEETQYVARAVLKNGLTVIVNEYRNHPLAAVLTYAPSGTFNEPGGNPGISRLLERMLYKASNAKDLEVIAKDTKALGGILGSRTNYDHTIHYTVVPSAQWKRALEIQSDALMNPKLEESDLKREIEMMLQEAQLTHKAPDIYAPAKLQELAFENRPGPIVRLWDETGLRSVEREKLLNYYRAVYNPGKLILAVSGDVNTSDILNEVTRLYGKYKPASEKAGATLSDGTQSAFRYGEILGPIDNPEILVAFHTAPIASEDYPALEILRVILGSGEGSILGRRLRDKKKVILEGSAELEAYSKTGCLTLRMQAAPDGIDKCEIAFFTELELFKRGEPDEAEMERALALLEREFWAEMETVQGRAYKLARFDSLGSWKAMESHIARLRKTKPADVAGVARKYLNLENCSLLEYLPSSADPRNLSAEVLGKTIRDLLPASVEQESAALEKTNEEAAIPKGTDEFKFSEVRHPIQKSSVWRGPELFIKEDHTTPIIHMGLFFPGGKLAETKENAGITSLLLRWLLKGSKSSPPDALNRQLEIFGARVSPIIAEDYFGIFFSVLSRNTEPAFDRLFEMMKSPRFDPEEFSRQKALQLAALRREKLSEASYPRALLDQSLFGDHPYALNPLGSESSLNSLTAEVVHAWYKSVIENRKPIVVIIGDTQGTSLARYFVRNFSGSRYQDAKLPEAFAKALEKRQVVEETWNNGQSVVMLGFQAPPEGEDDSYPLRLMEQFFDGMGGRLYDQLRDRQGVAYAVRFRYEPELRGGKITLFAATSPEKEEAALKGLESEVRRLLEDPSSYKDYRSSMNGAAGRYWIEQQDRGALISRLVRYILAGKGVEELVEHPARLQAVREEDLSQVGQRILKLEKAAVVRLHGKSGPQ